MRSFCWALVFVLSGTAAAAKPQTPPPPDLLSGARQLLLVTSPSWDSPRGELQRLERSTEIPQKGKSGQASAAFVRVGPPLSVWLGRRGLAWRSDAGAPEPPLSGPRKREGDGRSPAGALRLLQMRGYAQEAPKGVTLPYQSSGPLDRCVDDPEAAAYTQVTQAPPEGPPPSPAPMRDVPPDSRWSTQHTLAVVAGAAGLVGVVRTAPASGRGRCVSEGKEVVYHEYVSE